MGTRGDLVSTVYVFFIFGSITFLLMSIIYACMGETNCATGKSIPGHFFAFKSCIVCKCKVKGPFPLSWNWWVASRFLFTLWREIELFLVLILCNAKWCLANCFVLGSENSDPAEEFGSLCGCPSRNLPWTGFARSNQYPCWSGTHISGADRYLWLQRSLRGRVSWKASLCVIRNCLKPSQHELGMYVCSSSGIYSFLNPTISICG